MVAAQSARFGYAAAMGEHLDFVDDRFAVIPNFYRLVFRIKASLQPVVMRGYPGRAGVLVAFHRLDTAKRKHEAARRVDEIRARAQRPDNPIR